MVDWDQVERLRGKGWDWGRVAEDDRVQFAADPSAGDPGRQLRTLYYQRRSKAQRRGSAGKLTKGSGGAAADPTRLPGMLRIGMIGVPLFAIWAVCAFAFPSRIAVPLHVTWIYLALGLVIAAAVLIFALFRVTVPLDMGVLKTPIAIGCVLGLCFTGAAYLVGTVENCPTLATNAADSNEPQQWARYANPTWDSNGAPVFFFFGSIACPYCSASSWAMYVALKAFGTLNGWTLGSSNPNDVDPDTPEVELDTASEVSQYVALQAYEGNDPTQITTPTLPTCEMQSFVTTYDSGGSIPFVVLGGTYVHAGNSLIDPNLFVNSSTGVGYPPSYIMSQVNAQSGQQWNDIAGPAYTIEAILVKLNGGAGPSGVVNNPSVQAQLAQLH